ncbi:hypothetical protein M8J76_012492 [Diaphorina citri]|nr:hypothetical protein M8J76_012492 [Diaphorina citri]
MEREPRRRGVDVKRKKEEEEKKKEEEEKEEQEDEEERDEEGEEKEDRKEGRDIIKSYPIDLLLSLIHDNFEEALCTFQASWKP